MKRELYDQSGGHLKRFSKLASFGGLFISLIATATIWAGTESFYCTSLIWKISLAFNILIFLLVWLAYLKFIGTDELLGNGILTAITLLNFFWLFSFSGFYFYFIFSSTNNSTNVIILFIFTCVFIHRAYKIAGDINFCMNTDETLFSTMYCDEGSSFSFQRSAIFELEKKRKDRNPFNRTYYYASLLIVPFILVLNRILTPFFGDGHGFFLIIAFLSIPMQLWLIEIYVQVTITMIYLPIKIKKNTGKLVLMKNW